MLVRITCCTICGSDLHTWTGRRKSPVPIILGHEIVGNIVELGAGVTMDSGNNPLRVGDRITWTIMDNCGKCYFCREKGLMMKCSHLKKYGHDSCADWPHFVGGFAEYCYITPGTCVIRVPDELTDEEVAPANCALATVVAGWDAIEVRPFENVLIQGAGALGVYAAALASHYGCRRIIVADVMEHRLDFVKKFGATDTIDSKGLSDDEVIGIGQGSHGRIRRRCRHGARPGFPPFSRWASNVCARAAVSLKSAMPSPAPFSTATLRISSSNASRSGASTTTIRCICKRRSISFR